MTWVVLGSSWGMTKAQAEELKLLQTHGQMKDGTDKKTEHHLNDKRHQEANVTAYPVHHGLTVHICGVILKTHKGVSYAAEEERHF